MIDPQCAAKAMEMVDDDQISDYIETLFSSVFWKPNHFIILRGIPEKHTPREGNIPDTETCQPGLEENSIQDEVLIDTVRRKAIEWAQIGNAAFIIPNVMRSAQGSSENVELMVAVVVDIDTGDSYAKAQWCADHFGVPTMAVESGGRTDAGTPKLHLYWVLEEPEADVAAVVEARHQVALKAGGDLQFGRGTPNNPLGRAHQPIRIGGSVHGKGGVLRPVRVAHSSGPRYSFRELEQAIKRAPASPWKVTAIESATGPFDFGPTKNHRPDLDDVLVEDVHEGGEGADSRYAKVGQVIGGLIGTARRGTISLEDAKAQAYSWMQIHMKPPMPDATFNRHWHRLLEIDQRKQGAMPKAAVEVAKPMVVKEELGLREWGVHRWTSGEPKPREFLVDGLVLAGKPHLVVAEGGAGKTFAALDLGLKVAAWEEGSELEWWGQPIRAGGTVVMLTTEDDADELHIRIHDIDPDGLRYRAGDRWIVAPLVNMGGAFTLGERDPRTGNVVPGARWQQTLDLIRALPDVKLVIVDTLNTTLHGEENSATVVGEYAKLLQPVCGEIGAALVITHHIRKTDPNNPIHSPDEMAAAVRGSSALPAAFRAVLGVWHCHDFAKRMKAMGLEPKAKQLWRMGVLKANNPEMIDGVRFLLRAESGLLEDATERAMAAQKDTGVIHRSWMELAVRLAAEAGYPYSIGSKNDANGLFRRRSELPPCLRELGWRAMDGVRDDAVAEGRLVMTNAKGSKARTLLDVPEGAFAGNRRGGEEVRSGAMQAPEWGEWVWDEVQMAVQPIDAPRIQLGGRSSGEVAGVHVSRTAESQAQQGFEWGVHDKASSEDGGLSSDAERDPAIH